MARWRAFIAKAGIQRGRILVSAVVVSCAIFVWNVSAQDNPPAIPASPTEEAPTTLAPTPESQIPILTIAPMAQQKIGRRVMVSATLVNAEGIPQSNKPLLILVDGQQVRRARTNEVGVASLSIGADLSLGSHELTVTFIGTEAYSSVSATTTFTVEPLVLTLETVPSLAGIPISVNGQTVTTDAQGIATANIRTPGQTNLEVLQEPDTNIDESTRVSFIRWSDEGFQSSRTLDIEDDKHIQVGFSVSHPITYNFVDLSGEPVDAAEVSSLHIRTSTGEQITLTSDATPWLTSTRIARRRTGLEATNVLYSIESVMIDGTNVVNRYQQRFLVQANDLWTIEVLLYSASVRAADAFFGFPVGTGVSLEYPDGHLQTLPFGSSRIIHLKSLPRGTYRIKVEGVQSLTGWTPIALSRDQNVEIQVFSVIDVLVVLAVGGVISLTLLFYGRPFVMKLPLIIYRKLHDGSGLRRRSQSFQPAATTTTTGMFNLFFFHATDTNLDQASSALVRKRTSSPHLNRHASGNILQISGVERTSAGSTRINLPIGRLVCLVSGSTNRHRLLVAEVSRWQAEVFQTNAETSAVLNAKGDQALTGTDDVSTSNMNLLRSDERMRDSVFADICNIYGDLPDSQYYNYSAKHFDINSKRAQCNNCEGQGQVERPSALGEFVVCPVCEGTGYKSNILEVKLDDKSIADVLSMSVDEAAMFFAKYEVVSKKLQSLQSIGFGDLILGESGDILTPESIEYLKAMDSPTTHNLYAFNWPLEEAAQMTSVWQATALAELLDSGSAICIIENNISRCVIQNPIVMLRLGSDLDDGVRAESDTQLDSASDLGADRAL